MSTAAAAITDTTEATTDSRPWGWYGPEERSAAAKLGWQRRRGTYVPSAWERYHQAIQDADPCALRLYACDVVEAAQRHYLVRFPGDLRTVEAIAVARRYARGEATEQEREKAHHSLRHVYRAVKSDDDWHKPCMAAAGAASFALRRSLKWMAQWGTYWAYVADHGRAGANEGSRDQHLPALEALKQR